MLHSMTKNSTCSFFSDGQRLLNIICWMSPLMNDLDMNKKIIKECMTTEFFLSLFFFFFFFFIIVIAYKLEQSSTTCYSYSYSQLQLISLFKRLSYYRPSNKMNNITERLSRQGVYTINKTRTKWRCFSFSCLKILS